MASEAENQEINQLIEELEDDIVMTMNNDTSTCSPDLVKPSSQGKEDSTTMSRTPSFHEETTSASLATDTPTERTWSKENVLPQQGMNGTTTTTAECNGAKTAPSSTNVHPPAGTKDGINAMQTTLVVQDEEEVPPPLMEEANWDDVREYEIKAHRLPLPYTGYQKGNHGDDDDAWPRWHWTRGRRRPRAPRGWYDVRVAPPPPRDVSNLRYIHKELPQSRLNKDMYSVVIQVKPCQTMPQFGFYQGKLRFLGNPKTYPHVVQGELRKRFDVVCSIDGQGVLSKSMAFILTQLVSPPDVTKRTLRLRPFERMVEIEAVPDQLEGLEDEVQVIEVDEGSVEVVMENVSEEIPLSAMNDDDDVVYSSDDDSYEREIKAGVRTKPKLLRDDLSSKGDDDSDFVMDDTQNLDAEMDLEPDTVPPKTVTVAKPKLKAPPQRQPPAHAAANTYAQQMRQLQQPPKFQFQQPQKQGFTNGSAPPVQQQSSAFHHQNNPVFMAPNNPMPLNNGMNMGQPMTIARDYTVVLPVTPQGLGIRICESRGRVLFIGFADDNAYHPARHAFHKIGDAIVGIDGISFEGATPVQVTDFLRQHEGKHQRVLTMRTGWTGRNTTDPAGPRGQGHMNAVGTRKRKTGSHSGKPTENVPKGMTWNSVLGVWMPEDY